MITEADAIKFQKLYEQETGEKLSLEESLECAESLAEMIKLIYRPIKKRDSECTISDSGDTI